MDQQISQPDGFSRIDAAHQLSAADVAAQTVEAAKPNLVVAAAGLSEQLQVEQTHLQGHQLTIELTRRQREIDGRESQFNAFLATLDRDARSQRIKQNERAEDLAAREQEYATRLAALAQRETDIQSGENLGDTQRTDDSQLRELRHDLEEKRIRLEAEESALRYRWQKVQTQREASMQLIRHLMRSVERQRDSVEQEVQQQSKAAVGSPTSKALNKLAEELDQRNQSLIEAQSEVAREREELDTQRQQLRKQREEWSLAHGRAEARFNQQKTVERAEQVQRQEALDRRSDELSKRQAALDHLQANVTSTHRETLELRIATEQLWSQLGEKVAPHELAETLGQLRSKLREHYRTAEDTLASQRNELQDMASKLDEQKNRICDDRQQLQQWVERRNEEIEFQAARLVAREQELESQQAQGAQTREKWEQQRYEYEDEIRRLQAKLRQDRTAA